MKNHLRGRYVSFVLTAALATACQADRDRTTDGNDQAYVRIPKSALSAGFVQDTGFNRDHKTDDVFAFGYLPRHLLRSLPAAVSDNLVVLDSRYSRSAFDAKTLALTGPEDELPLAMLKEGYHDYTQLTDELQNLARAYPDLAELSSAGQSVNGRELWLMKISDHASSDEAEPKLLYIANMHGDEVVGRELMIYLIRTLLNGYSGDSRIKHLVDNAQIYIMPSMNPDGFEDGDRTNANGVDLNRSFPDFSSDPNDSALGRPVETQAIMNLHAEHHFVLALNFHGGALCVNLPWDTIANDSLPDRFADDALMNKLGRDYADANGPMHAGNEFDHGVTYGFEWYEIDGGMQDWANYFRQSTHATVELSKTKWPVANELDGFWQDNVESLIAYLESGLVGINLRIVDNGGNRINDARITLQTSPKRSVVYKGGVAHRPALPGRHSATITAPGHSSVQLDFDSTKFHGQLHEVVLH